MKLSNLSLVPGSYEKTELKKAAKWFSSKIFDTKCLQNKVYSIRK